MPQLQDLYPILPEVIWHGKPTTVFSDIVSDSREVTPGSLFVDLTIPHPNNQGKVGKETDYTQDALQRGATMVISQKNPPQDLQQAAWGQTSNSRLTLSKLAAWYYDYPAHKLTIVGVTGTNGKTTTCHFLRAIWQASGLTTGMLGTIGYEYGNTRIPARFTTPGILELQQHFAQMCAAGVTHVVMEVSSHALFQERTIGIPFAAAIFTNLSQDHLDYHSTMEDYLATKGRLFQQLSSQSWAIVNGDVPESEQIQQMSSTKQVSRFALETSAEFCAYQRKFFTPGGSFPYLGKLPGKHNMANALAAVSCAYHLGCSLPAIQQGVSNLTMVPGRLEEIPCSLPFQVYVDYAHTPDALAKVLASLKQQSTGRLLLVFGCGGNRDQAKRPLMGAVAARYADKTWITNDNPRHESPEQIARAICGGMGRMSEYVLELDRREAIFQAVEEAGPGDIVLVAGKGHERQQIIGYDVLSFDDSQMLQKALQERKESRTKQEKGVKHAACFLA